MAGRPKNITIAQEKANKDKSQMKLSWALVVAGPKPAAAQVIAPVPAVAALAAPAAVPAPENRKDYRYQHAVSRH